MPDGPNAYKDGDFDIGVKAGDTVIDAGAYIGDFAAYAAVKGATAYAFEPEERIFKILTKTAELNRNKIIPVQKGLGDFDGEAEFFADDADEGAASISPASGDKKGFANKSKISITRLDTFAADKKLERLDFIKADIEGAERGLLAGAKEVLREFAPKLAICTYHLSDDRQVLESLILDANSKYRVRQGPNKLYAAVRG